jgi:nitroreductase
MSSPYINGLLNRRLSSTPSFPRQRNIEMPELKSFHDVVRDRHSVRKFFSTPVPDTLMRAVLEDAQHAPSNCNTQPWQIHIVSGAKRDALSKAILADDATGHLTPDFSFDLRDFHGVYSERAKAQGASYYQAIGVAREANEDRRTAARLNLDFFGAPHVALLFMPSFGDNVRVAGDIGMYGQSFLLSLTAHGLGGIPQTMLGFYADTIRKVLGIDPSMKMLFGVSFGYPDETHAANKYRIEKAPIEDSVIFHE